MIVYVATYPRSGNGVLRHAIWLNFGYLTTNGYPDAPGTAEKYAIRPARDPSADWLISYQALPGDRRPGVAAPALERLTPKLRQALASARQLYFIKTHAPPYPSYFPGERVLSMIRHPAPAIASELELKRRTSAGGAHRLDTFIRGSGPAGNWSDYHARWAAAEVPRLVFRYETSLADPMTFLGHLASFLHLPLPEARFETLAEAHARNPLRNPAAGPDGWRRTIDAAGLDRLWQAHGTVAGMMGYGRTPDAAAEGDEAEDAIPDEAAIPDDDMARMDQLAEVICDDELLDR